MAQTLLNLLEKAAAGASSFGDVSSATSSWLNYYDDKATDQDKATQVMDASRYMFGILLTIANTITKNSTSKTIFFGLNVVPLTTSLMKSCTLIEIDLQNPRREGSLSNGTWVQIIETLTMVTDFLTSIPSLSTNLVVQSVNAAANVVGMLAALFGTMDTVKLQSTVKKLDTLLEENGLSLGNETRKIFDTKHTDKYTGDNWNAIEPVYSFFLKLIGKNVELSANFDPFDIAQMTDVDKIVQSSIEFLIAADGIESDTKWIFWAGAEDEAFKMTNAILELFGYPKLEIQPKDQPSEIYSILLNKIYDDVKDSNLSFSLTPLIKQSKLDTNALYNGLNSDDKLAYFYALVKGNPFVLIGANYTKHNLNGELSLYNPITGQGQLTEEYIRERASFLDGYIKYNLADGITPSIAYGDGYYFDKQLTDDANGLVLKPETVGSGNNEKQVHFGEDGIDKIVLAGGGQSYPVNELGGRARFCFCRVR